ncbi:hypothetical protein E2C01_043311 [Portunus trituberculatus]|uniref:Uncharacterized protein n=1 Tax=Portunus trituberculatus TaxID=210409 RepID=A0A5B7FX77_PORTR|nr:hypothetical protein [Portunus trituberculatus]
MRVPVLTSQRNPDSLAIPHLPPDARVTNCSRADDYITSPTSPHLLRRPPTASTHTRLRSAGVMKAGQATPNPGIVPLRTDYDQTRVPVIGHYVSGLPIPAAWTAREGRMRGEEGKKRQREGRGVAASSCLV